MFYTMVTVPSASQLVASTTEYSATLGTEFLSYTWILVGIIVAALAVKFFGRALLRGVRMVFGGRRGRRGRRR